MKHKGKESAKGNKPVPLSKWHRNGLFVMALAFILFQANLSAISSMFPLLLFSNIVNAVLFFAYAFVFIAYEKNGARHSAALTATFILFMLNFATAFVGLGGLGMVAFISTLTSSFSFLYYFPLLMLAFFLISIGMLLFNSRYRRAAYAFFVFAIVISALLGYFISSHETFIPSDEGFIAFAQVGPFLHGASPYANGIGKALYNNYTQGMVDTPTFNTLNEIIGSLNYPALYLFASVPFYFSQSQIAQGMGNAVKSQFAVFLVLMILAVFLALDRKLSEKPVYWVVLFLSFFMALLSTPVEFLMMALLVLSYAYLENRYAWILLGLCISLQELLWLPVAFLLLYTLRNQGIRKAAYNAVGAAAVFLAINAYFIILDPAAFLNGIFTPINGFLLPSANAPFSYLVNIVYGTSLGIDLAVFAAVSICLAIIFLAFNNKELVGIFSLIPLMFTLHSNIEVFSVFFVAFAVICMFIYNKEPMKDTWKRFAQYKNISAYAVCGLMVFVFAIVAGSHAGYLRNFNISVTNQTAGFNSGSSIEHFNATIIANSIANKTVYARIIAYTNYGSVYLPASMDYNSSSLSCSAKACSVNFGEVNLTNGTSYVLRANTFLNSNGMNVYAEQLMLYNDEYAYYASPLIFPKGSMRA